MDIVHALVWDGDGSDSGLFPIVAINASYIKNPDCIKQENLWGQLYFIRPL